MSGKKEVNGAPAADAPPEGAAAPGRRVLVCTPCGDGKVHVPYLLGLIQCMQASGGAVRPYFLVGNSNIHEARNKCAHYFKTKARDCDTLVFIDSDIGFDLECFTNLMEGSEDIAIAHYSRKSLGEQPVDFGMGFCRISRHVFEELDAWLSEDGEEMLHRYMDRGELVTDCFYTGASADARWFGEDTGFWHWCALKGFTMRKETRAKLIHIGTFYYGFPEQVPGMVHVSAGAQ